MENLQGGHLIKDILFTVNSFQSISFSHVVWQGNAVAHALAQRARHSFPLLVWMEAIPPDVLSFVLSDFPHHVINISKHFILTKKEKRKKKFCCEIELFSNTF